MKLSVIIVAILAVLGLGGFLLTSHPKDKTVNKTSTQTTTPSTSSKKSSSDSMKNMDMSDSSSSTSSTPTAANSVEISNFAFSPASITVKKGTTVTWTNKDSVRHDVIADDPSDAAPNGPLLDQGKTYSFTFTKVGTYSYHCTPHPYMKGTVAVTE